MSYFLPGVASVNSISTAAVDPSTDTILAVVTSTGVSTAGGLSLGYAADVAAYFYLGTSTQATEWWVEHCLSTGLGSTAIKDRTVFHTSSGNTHQYVKRYTFAVGDLLRVRIAAAFTGRADAKIQVEVIG